MAIIVLTKNGWCKKHQESTTYDCRNSSYCHDRCVHSYYLKNLYCNYSYCKLAFDDYNELDFRSNYWNKCKKSISMNLKLNYGYKYTIGNDEIDY
ncbi:hypothetical protein PIROE2DRAFT_17874 [Piromyces sp. E2]|nr:hypothetical protein PIROE2DRAFT_17874 [Piromyces sp. E2]|eukprot:OUM57208.1 hypothetical protein PIROE2DRAFT_17874 [Piromyces sp. E2]